MKLNLLFSNRSGSWFFKKAPASLHDEIGIFAGDGRVRFPRSCVNEGLELMRILRREVKEVRQHPLRILPTQLPAPCRSRLSSIPVLVDVDLKQAGSHGLLCRQTVTMLRASRPWLISLNKFVLVLRVGIICTPKVDEKRPERLFSLWREHAVTIQSWYDIGEAHVAFLPRFCPAAYRLPREPAASSCYTSPRIMQLAACNETS